MRLWVALAVSFGLLVPYLALVYRAPVLESLLFPIGGAATVGILLLASWLRERLRSR